ncbi:LOW QUALITY PROTEIN: F-box/LRR-repeat MAX2 homolog A-like [Mangifera indica]|uniref:LOW QUALITY PROTEIN: F-box/LRR-repeat MAX2 homolog A-like n=1 Tax=Mangifera indica TaxID=29780 RepID=UPI001CFBE65C|nr:LOW QUALITY PROTEIN: F-box/LRR-repeat MAX2 homolog A-like [Mangifera indica]
MAAASTTSITHLPDVILSNIFASISDTRSRNSLSLVSRKFHLLERITRTSLTLRGNARYLHFIPHAFRSVVNLDLSLLSPWGHSLLSSSSPSDLLLAHLLRQAFPSVTSLTLYCRSPTTLQILLPQWPGLSHVKLVRWHQRPQVDIGADFYPLFEQCKSLTSLDVSTFYYWTEDLPPVLQAFPNVSANLTHLNLLTTSFSEGFKSREIQDITAACPNLNKFLVACMFDPRYIGFVGDETLLAITTNCPKLSLLHLTDTSSLANLRGDPESDGFTSEDARISRETLIQLFSGLPSLEDLVLDVCKNVRDSGFAFEVMKSKCPNLKALKLGQFHGLCLAIDSQLDGVALCGRLESLSIKNCGDLTDMVLIAIGRGCCRLAKLEVEGCKFITVQGLRTVACLLRKTLVQVGISCCKNLDAVASCRALEPIRDRIQKLHIDCVWNGVNDEGSSSRTDTNRSKKKQKYCFDDEDGSWCKTWESLKSLSVWIEVGELLSPLPKVGLDDCPNLEEIIIKVEGDTRRLYKPSESAFGLGCLAMYPRLLRMKLNCGEAIGFALTAPSGQMDLNLWERFFLKGIGELRLNELDYWPPQDRDVNHRSLSLPAVGLLAQCSTLRKLFIHGTAHEHFMMFLPEIPNLRDVQLREDYYPAPDTDMSTEMRADSCCRFEDALNRKRIAD